MSLKDSIKRMKEKGSSQADWESIVRGIAERMVAEKLAETQKEIVKSIKDLIKGLVVDYTEKYIKTLSHIKGERGLPGISGRSITGMPGRNGMDGRDGKDGTRGRDGKDGFNGLNGKDGSPDNPTQIASKLNILTEAIDQKVIRGLERALLSLTRQIGEAKSVRVGGGGGMGNVSLFTLAGDGSTTTITLSSDVAANGRALWAYYNGQWLQPSTHYTVSGRTVSLTFTPAADTTVEGFFIRT